MSTETWLDRAHAAVTRNQHMRLFTDRWRPVVFADREGNIGSAGRSLIWLPSVFALGGALAAAFFIRFGIGNLDRRALPTLAGLTLGGAIFGLVCAAHHRFMRVGPLRDERG